VLQPRPSPRVPAFAALSYLIFGVPLLMSLSGMTCGPSDPDPCELDRLGCESPEDPDFYLASCPTDLTDPLEVEVGTGETSFSAFADGAGPVVHYGPQGGQHVFLGLRVTNPRLDLSPKLKVTFYLGQGPDCAPPATGEVASCAMRLGTRTLILGAPGFELIINGEGDVEEAGLIVFVEAPSREVPSLITVTVEDPCRRIGSAYQTWTRY